VIDTKLKIEEMINSLTFQPSYFSGSKVDFKNRMEFLAKLTRPAANGSDVNFNDATGKWEGAGGFSFTSPPVCHLRLGNWYDHDIIINSVSYDYSNAPWTSDFSDVMQPMWANVTINFNIVGSAGGGGTPLTSTDLDGFYGTSTSRRR
jgi:hypothetical protein